MCIRDRIYGVHKENIIQNVEFLAKNSDAYRLQKQDLSQIDSNLVYQAHGNIIDKKQHIFIIIGESFAQWPLLDEYANLQLGENVRAIDVYKRQLVNVKKNKIILLALLYILIWEHQQDDLNNYY